MITRRKRQQIARDMGMSPNYMDKVTAGLRQYPERYKNAVIQSGHMTIIDVEMMLDWIKYREILEAGGRVPEFRREDYQ